MHAQRTGDRHSCVMGLTGSTSLLLRGRGPGPGLGVALVPTPAPASLYHPGRQVVEGPSCQLVCLEMLSCAKLGNGTVVRSCLV